VGLFYNAPKPTRGDMNAYTWTKLLQGRCRHNARVKSIQLVLSCQYVSL